MNTLTTTVNLLDNEKFRRFIEAFKGITTQDLPLDEVRKLNKQFFLPEGTVFEPVQRIEDVEILGRDNNRIPLRLYIPRESQKMRTLIYFHRGGWVFGSIDEAEPLCRKLANQLDCIVVAVDYRLAPEYPFPKPLFDCYDATQWVSDNIYQYGGDKKNLVVCGESAGGNLAAAVALMARDNKRPALAAQLLIYPIICSGLKDAPYENCVDQHFLTKDAMKFFWSMYIQTPGEDKNPYASPDLAMDLWELPPALIVTAEYDALHAEADAYADTLREAGIKVISKCYPEVIHGFLDLPIYDDSQKTAWIDDIGHYLKKLS